MSFSVLVGIFLLTVFYIVYCQPRSNGGIGSDSGFDTAVNTERNRGQRQIIPITAIANKPTHHTLCGIGLKIQNGSLTISSIKPAGLFAYSGLKVGMIVKTINNVSGRKNCGRSDTNYQRCNWSSHYCYRQCKSTL